jgi:histidinol-phosphate aminotransferase
MNAHLRRDLQSTGAAYSRPNEPAGLLRAHMNEMTGDWPAAEKAELLGALATLNLGLYPESQASLTARLEARLGAPRGAVLLGPSSGALLDLIALAGLDADDVVAVPEPGFTLYPLIVRRARGALLSVPVGHTLPLAGFLAAARAGAKQLWITNPNNPTGAWIDPQELLALCTDIGALPRPPLVVIDEAYVEFAPQTARLLVDRFAFVVLLRTWSKALGSAGLRLGYLVGAPDFISRLAALQLPYSISAPSLCALDIALTKPAPFEALVRQTSERRVRLMAALAGNQANAADVQVTPSAANFLYIAPNKVPELAAAGVLARAWPGTSHCRISLSDERVAETTARVYGASLAPAPTAAEYQPARAVLVLDVDGVLIEAEASFRAAVALALGDLHPQLPWADAMFRTMKRVSGMNNDFRLAAAVGWLWSAQETARDVRFAALVSGHTPGLSAAELGAVDNLEPTYAIRVAHHYRATQRIEEPLITGVELEQITRNLAIYTGRNSAELELAEETLGFRLPAVCDRGGHVRKPMPGGLLQLRDAFGADSVLFVGDTRDDLAALEAARAELPHVRWAFCAVGPARDEILPGADGVTTFSFATLRSGVATLRQWICGELG